MDDPFARAGKELQRGLIRDDAARDQALAALDDLLPFIASGIESFYGGPRPNPWVERAASDQLTIHFGHRPDKCDRILVGPKAILLVTPDGRLLWAEITGWIEPPDHYSFDGIEIEPTREAVTPKLIAFLTNGETSYRNLAPASWQ